MADKINKKSGTYHNHGEVPPVVFNYKPLHPVLIFDVTAMDAKYKNSEKFQELGKFCCKSCRQLSMFDRTNLLEEPACVCQEKQKKKKSKKIDIKGLSFIYL